MSDLEKVNFVVSRRINPHPAVIIAITIVAVLVLYLIRIAMRESLSGRWIASGNKTYHIKHDVFGGYASVENKQARGRISIFAVDGAGISGANGVRGYWDKRDESITWFPLPGKPAAYEIWKREKIIRAT